MSVYPPIGQRVVYSGLLGFVTAVDVAAGSVVIDYHKMYKYDADGTTIVQCHIAPTSSKVSSK